MSFNWNDQHMPERVWADLKLRHAKVVQGKSPELVARSVNRVVNVLQQTGVDMSEGSLADYIERDLGTAGFFSASGLIEEEREAREDTNFLDELQDVQRASGIY